MVKLLSCSFRQHFFTGIAIALFFTSVFIPHVPAYGHLYGYNVQEWKNQKYDILIQFETDPQTPSVGKNATLNFSVQNLQTGGHFENFTDTVTIIKYDQNSSSNDIAYKFASQPEKTGDFSHSDVFENGGTYEIFLRIDTPTFINVSKFVVFVSSPQFQIMNLVYLLLPFMIVVGIIAVVGVLLWRRIYKNK